MPKTKIVATLGPASQHRDTLRAMLREGMDVARINLSHGDPAAHKRLFHTFREAAAAEGLPYVGTMFDTRGAEIRVGDIGGEGISLQTRQEILLVPIPDGVATTATEVAGRIAVPIRYAALAAAVNPGERILLDDGQIHLEVLEAGPDGVRCRVTAGGRLHARKKVTLPRPPKDLPPLTESDRTGLRLGVELGIDFVAASFIGTVEHVLHVRRVIEEFGGNQALIAKIENRSAVEHFVEILEAADGIMIARGDLGVELPPEEVPLLQKRLIAACNRMGKPVITATQMLESMIGNPTPTRAEASDVANAILDGTDAVMLSAETATGRYPVEAVRMMAQIARRAEEHLDRGRFLVSPGRFAGEEPSVADAVSYACCATAHSLDAHVILTATQSGHTARMVSRHRPRPWIAGATPLGDVARKLSLVWGVAPIVVAASQRTDELLEESLAAAVDEGMVPPGALVVMTAGVPVGVPGTTNLLQVMSVGRVLIDGTGIGRSSRAGIARVAERPEDVQAFTEGDILVTHGIDPQWIPMMERAGGLVTVEGGLTSHGAIAALQFGIPAVVGAREAMERINDGEVITVDGRTGRVYQGRVTVR